MSIVSALASVLSALAWPFVAVLALWWYRRPIKKLIGRTTKVKIGNFEAEAKFHARTEQAGDAAKGAPLREPTRDEIARAGQIEELAQEISPGVVRRTVEQFASDYEYLRSSLPSGEARTLKMEILVAKMRAVSLAAWDMRYELSRSASPGRRLQAIAILQVEPEYDLIDYLVDRVRDKEERPFIVYHALVALEVAAENQRAAVYAELLSRAAEKVGEVALPADSDRAAMLARFNARVVQLQPA